MTRVMQFILIFNLFIFNIGAKDFFVAPWGDNDSTGDKEQPFLTIQNAVDEARSGDSIIIRKGKYYERLKFRKSGDSIDSPITLKNYKSEKVILDGKKFNPRDNQYMVRLHGVSNIVIRNITIQNFQTKRRGVTPIGISISRGSSNIVINKVEVTNIRHNYHKRGGSAHGIAIYGNSSKAMKNITVKNSHLHHLRLGSSEALVVNGNVDGFLIMGNHIHDVDNIAIDAIGYEGIGKSNDYARNGMISKNHIHDVNSGDNPAYRGSNAAGGIYVDGGKDIIIERNIVYDSDIGIEIASEAKKGVTKRIIVRSNLVYLNRMTGLAMGGFDKERGWTKYCQVIGNTFYKNDTRKKGYGEIFIQNYTYKNILKNNIIYSNSNAQFIKNRDKKTNIKNIVDYNIFYSENDKQKFRWKGVNYYSLEDLQKSTGTNENSIFENPEFTNPDDFDFSLSFPSPAISKAEHFNQNVIGKKDLAGQSLIVKDLDMGAYQFQQ